MSLQARRGVEYANRPESSDCDQTFSLPFDVRRRGSGTALRPYRRLCTMYIQLCSRYVGTHR